MKAKRIVQALVFIGGFVPVLAGLAGVIWGQQMLETTPENVSADSHYRYLSGLLLAIGLAFWSCLADLEHKTGRFRLLTAIVFTGGIARLYALMTAGVPDRPMQFALLMELVVTPLLALAQSKVALDLAARPNRQ